jgi:hypothetical protein
MAISKKDEAAYHIGHKIVCVGYGRARSPANVAIECETCGMVLADWDN